MITKKVKWGKRILKDSLTLIPYGTSDKEKRMKINQKLRWLRYMKRFKLKSLEEVELMESIVEQEYDKRKFFIQDIGKNEYWSVKEK